MKLTENENQTILDLINEHILGIKDQRDKNLASKNFREELERVLCREDARYKELRTRFLESLKTK